MSVGTVLEPRQVADELAGLVGADRVDTDPKHLREASVDRFRKYTAVNGIYDGPYPMAIVTPRDVPQVAAVLSWANARGVPVVPRTGRTATEGGLETVVEGSIVVDGSGLDRIIDIDPENMMATVQCGVALQVLEDEVRKHGLTTGHSPQSKPLAQLGGLTATRSIGQLSTLYGGIEDMVVGLEAVFPGVEMHGALRRRSRRIQRPVADTLPAERDRSVFVERVEREADQLAVSVELLQRDEQIADLVKDCTPEEVYQKRKAAGITRVFKMVDTCSAEFEARTPYFYSTFETEAAKS